MNKDELEKLINPSWLKASQRIQEQLKLANSLNHQPIALSNMQKQLEAYNSSIALQQPKWLETAKTIAEQSNRILKSVDQSELIKSIKRFDDMSHQAALALRSNDSHSRLMESVKSASVHMKSIQKSGLFDQFNKLSTISKAFEFSAQQRTSLDLASKLYGLQSIDTIANLKNSPLSQYFQYHENTTNNKSVAFQEESIYEIDEEIIAELSGTDDFELLPLPLQSKIFNFLKLALLTIFLNLMSNYIYDQRQELAQSLNELTQVSEVKSYVRNSSSKFEKDILNAFRVVVGNNVNLRTYPSIKSDVILRLNTGTLLEVLDKSNRSWILVEIEHGDDVVQGWISRKYTVYFK
ncbi:MAG: SH3 domain-containing protein [Methylococcales bacterium]